MNFKTKTETEKTMKTTQNPHFIRTSAAVILKMLNFEPGREFIANVAGNQVINKSGVNGLEIMRNGYGNKTALRVSNENETVYYFEPFMVEVFPDGTHSLSFQCDNAIFSNS